jgi:PAS domain S-box-containing protein
MGMNLYTLDTPRYANLIEQRIKKLQEKGAITFESAHFCKDMSIMSVEVHARIIKLGDREFVISVARDITERKQRERELETIFDGIEDGILFIDKNCQILRVNRAILKIFDKSDFSDLIGKKCFADVFKKDSMCENCPAEMVFKDSNAHHAHKISNITDKGRIILAVSTFPIKDDDGRVNNAIVHVKNITETVKLEDQILYQERLTGIGELAAGIAHEIRNPLGNIAASAQLCLSKHELPINAMKHLRIILKNSENANKIVKSLLGFAKQREISFKIGDINQVIKSACELVKARCAKRHVILTKKLPRRLPQIILDENAMEEAFLNFILNALDAMTKGGRLIITAYLDSQNNEIVVNFSDTGEGIPQEYLDKIFQPFFTTKRDGVGLGLCLAQQVINYHKGKLNIKSKVMQGTEVEVRLPISRN